jgi:hypothetical protein
MTFSTGRTGVPLSLNGLVGRAIEGSPAPVVLNMNKIQVAHDNCYCAPSSRADTLNSQR